MNFSCFHKTQTVDGQSLVNSALLPIVSIQCHQTCLPHQLRGGAEEAFAMRNMIFGKA